MNGRLLIPDSSVEVSDGQYQLIVGELNAWKYPELSIDSGATWSSLAILVIGYGAAISGNGQYMIVVNKNGNVIKSSDYGATWSNAFSGTDYRCAAISSDGQYQFSAKYNGYIMRSTDYGATWSAVTSTSQQWVAVAISANGQYITAITVTSITYISNNYGSSFTNYASQYKSVDMNATGQYQLFGYVGKTYLSSNYGVTRTEIFKGPGFFNFQKQWVAISNDGSRITIAAQDEAIYVSTDYGANFTTVSINKTWNSIAMSGDGKYQTAVGDNAKYVSSDYGANWTSQTVNYKYYFNAINKLV